jgi:ABC-type amino acid transport substrate-binding protein
LQKFANKKLKTGKLRVKVTFVPVTPEQVEAALLEGMGDFVANPVVITPERAKRFAFSIPVVPNVTQIVVTNPDFGTLLSVDDLAGKEIYVNPLAASYANLQKNSERL